jgi:hypothetical protein
MPLALPGRTKDAVVMVPGDADWRTGVSGFLSALGADDAHVGRHLSLLEERAAGRRPWHKELTGRMLPNGRPMPPGRAYAEMLVTESVLPLYDGGGFLFSLDLHDPGNEADVSWFDPSFIEFAIVADQGLFTGEDIDASEGAEERLAIRAARGARLGHLVSMLVEHLGASFAYADVGSSGGVVTSAANPASVVHASPGPLRPSDFLWSITVWGPESIDLGFKSRLATLSLDERHVAKLDGFIRPHVRLERRLLASGARFLQFRFLLGTEQRGERTHLDSPLAEQLGLRSTNLQYRS